jgi:hypothetical protein
VVLADTSAGQLAVTVSLNMGGYDDATREKTIIDVFLQHDGKPVQFIKGEHVDCGRLPLTAFTGSFEATFATASIAGKVVTCTYTSGQQSTLFTFRAPQQLEIVSPRQHERVPHGSNTVIQLGGGTSPLWVVALSPSAKAVANADAITATSAMLDTSTLQTGEGSIAVTDPTNVPLADIQGSQFQSIAGSSRRATIVAVVWI